MNLQQQNETYAANAAAADAKHDFSNFKSILSWLRNKRNQFNQGLPYGARELYNEPQTFDSVVDVSTRTNVPNPDEYEGEEECSKEDEEEEEETGSSSAAASGLYSPLNYFEVTNDNNKKENFETHPITTINGNQYNVNGISALSNPADYTSGASDEDKYIDALTIIRDLNIEHNCVFVIDAVAVSVLKILKSGDKLNKSGHIWRSLGDEWFTIFIIDDVETRNDPAGKTSRDPYFDSPNGVQLIFLSPSDPRTITYKYAYGSTPEHSFFSRYTFKLLTNYNNEGCTLLIDNGTNVATTIDNPKEQNAINYVSDILSRLIGRSKSSTPKDIFNINVKYQQKRSGDWLQVLLCLLLMSRTYVDKNDEEYTGSDFSKVYFLTHDQIAVSFALYMGVSVLFTHGYSSTIMKLDIADLQSIFRYSFQHYLPQASSSSSSSESQGSPFVDDDNIIAAYANYRQYFHYYYRNRLEIKKSILDAITELESQDSFHLEVWTPLLQKLFIQVSILHSFDSRNTAPKRLAENEQEETIVTLNESYTKLSELLNTIQPRLSSVDDEVKAQITNAEEVKKEIESIQQRISYMQSCKIDDIQDRELQSKIVSLRFDPLPIEFSRKTNRILKGAEGLQLLRSSEMFQFIYAFPFLDREIKNRLNRLFTSFLNIPDTSIKDQKIWIVVTTFIRECVVCFDYQEVLEPIIEQVHLNEEGEVLTEKEAMVDVPMVDVPMVDVSLSCNLINVVDEQCEELEENVDVPCLPLSGKRKTSPIDDSDGDLEKRSREREEGEREREEGEREEGEREEGERELSRSSSLSSNDSDWIPYPRYSEDEDDNMSIHSGGGGTGILPIYSYLNRVRFNKHYTYNLEINHINIPYLLVPYMVGIAMIHQLQNQDVYQTLDYTTYQSLYFKLKYILENPMDPTDFHLQDFANLFFAPPIDGEGNKLEYLLSRQLGVYYFALDTSKPIYRTKGYRDNLITTLSSQDPLRYPGNPSGYRVFVSHVHKLVIEIGSALQKQLYLLLPIATGTGPVPLKPHEEALLNMPEPDDAAAAIEEAASGSESPFSPATTQASYSQSPGSPFSPGSPLNSQFSQSSDNSFSPGSPFSQPSPLYSPLSPYFLRGGKKRNTRKKIQHRKNKKTRHAKQYKRNTTIKKKKQHKKRHSAHKKK
jgi:hypothetical protein